MLSLLHRSALRAAPTWLPSCTGAAAATAQRAALVRVAPDARRTFLTSPLSLAPSKPTEASATGAKKSASKPTATATGISEPKKSASTMGTKRKATKVGRPEKAAKVGRPTAKVSRPKKVAKVGRPKKNKDEPPKHLTASELPPKRSLSPWILFLLKYRLDNGVKSANAAEAAETMKVASVAWRSLSDTEKRPYYDQAKAGRSEYLKRRAEYYANMSDVLMTRLNVHRKKKGARMVTRRHSVYTTGITAPRTSYAYYFTEYLRNNQKHASMHYFDFVRQAAAVWRGMSESERAPFVELARKDRERYRQDIVASG